MVDKKTDTVKVQFDEESQEYFIASPIFEKYFQVGDAISWSEKSDKAYILSLTKAKE
jgi:hypothetical protein